MMGCRTYITGYHDHINLRFDETDDGVCLCTLDERDSAFGPEEIRAMAYLGAAVALWHLDDSDKPQAPDDWRYLPHNLPPAIRSAIDAALPLADAATGEVEP